MREVRWAAPALTVLAGGSGGDNPSRIDVLDVRTKQTRTVGPGNDRLPDGKPAAR
jgi:hypothetical protein